MSEQILVERTALFCMEDSLHIDGSLSNAQALVNDAESLAIVERNVSNEWLKVIGTRTEIDL